MILLAGAAALALLAGAPAVPTPPPACGAALVVGDRLEAGDDVHLTAGDDHFRPGVFGADAETFTYGDAGSDCLVGGPAYDHLEGGTGDDRLTGGNGPDELFGGPGDDVLLTGRDDERSATSGGELADGGAGNDVVLPGPGSTRIVLGPGDDRVLTTDGTGGTIACGPGEDTVVADALDELTGCEHVTRRAAPATTLRHEGAGVTLRFRAPWTRRDADGLIAFSAVVTYPAARSCGGMSQDVTSRGRDVVVKLRPGPEAPPCRGRWIVQVEATFAHDANSECDGGGCGIASAPVTPRRAFRIP